MKTLSTASSDSSSDPLRSAPGAPARVLAFHRLLPRCTFSSTNYSPRRFDRLLSDLRHRQYRFGTIDAALAASSDDQVAITFDDGYQHLLEYLPPLIRKHHIQPLVFMPTAYIGRSNCWDYGHALRPVLHLNAAAIATMVLLGVEFGTHGHTHVDLRRCHRHSLEIEIEHSKKLLEDVTGRPVRYISYPFGRYNEQVLEMVGRAGYAGGFTIAFPEHGDSALTLGRYAVYGYDTAASVRRRLCRGRLYSFERWKARATNRLAAGTVLLQRLRRQEGR